MAIQTIYDNFTLLTGGTSAALDSVDGNSLVDGDKAYVAATATGVFYVYRLNATSGAAESSPDVIAPDTNAGNKRWILFSVMAQVTPSGSIIPASDMAYTLGDSTHRWLNIYGQVNTSAPAATTSFAGTVSAASLTVTFTSAADYALCKVGSTIVSNAETRYVCRLLGSNQVTVGQTTTWAGSSAITSIQDPQWVSSSSGTTRSFVAADGSYTTVLTSSGAGYFRRTVGGNVGIGTTVPTSTLHVTGSVAKAIVNKTIGYTATSTDHTITCDATSAAFTITLPAATGCSGRLYTIKKIDGTVNAVTIDGNSTETIDGALTKALTTQWESITIQSNGTTWYII